MPKKKLRQNMPGNKARPRCHFISNTHWDREWRYGAQRVRHMLVDALDMLLDILEQDPDYRHYHLDSQTLPIEEYLEIRPEKAAVLKKHVRDGRLAIGPWYCLPDEFCVSGEMLIRNLLRGHRIAAEFGPVSKTGYSPFSWGQISQMPQIYLGFGIDTVSFYRGVDTIKARHSEFTWEGPDGSRVLATRLARKPRHNIWYLVLRRVFWDPKDSEDRVLSWMRGRGPFRLADGAHPHADYRYTHPEFAYYDEDLAAFAEEALHDQDDDWTQPHRFWSSGHDWGCPDIREVRLVEDCNRALGRDADVVHSTVRDFHEGVRRSERARWPVLRGEMRHTATARSSAALCGWILSARTPVKQDNFRTEKALLSYAEPLAAFASLLGAPHPGDFLALSFRWLLRNHGHDSIGGCSRDIVHEDMVYRSRQSREISECVTERAFLDIAGSIDLSGWSAEDIGLVVYNPTPRKRSEVLDVILDIPDEWNTTVAPETRLVTASPSRREKTASTHGGRVCDEPYAGHFEILDENGCPVPCQTLGVKREHLQLVQIPNDAPNFAHVTRHALRVAVKDVPAMGYLTCRVVPAKKRRSTARDRSLRTGPRKMENEHVSVTLNANGTLTVRDKHTGKRYGGLGFFRDRGEAGDPWNHVHPAKDRILDTRKQKARVRLVHEGPLETAFEVSLDWALPARVDPDGRSRSRALVACPIRTTVTLRQGQRWVECVTELENASEDHLLQVCFPTGLDTDAVDVQGQFDVLRRPFTPPSSPEYTEPHQDEQPMNSFVDVSDGEQGLALLNEGLKAYEAMDNRSRTVCLTLLRCFPMRIFENDYSKTDKGSQCPGRHVFRYGILPHEGGWINGRVWQASEDFNLGLLAGQMGTHTKGTGPMQKSFLEVTPDGLHVSAVKRAENGKGWIARLFNPFNRKVTAKVRLNGGRAGLPTQQSPIDRQRNEYALPRARGRKWRTIRTVSLEELPQKDLRANEEGWVSCPIGKKQILTLEFR